MPLLEAKRRYSSRWSNAPILDGQGRGKVVQLMPRDIEIFKLLSRYRYLRADFIHAFIGGNLSGLIARLNQLQRPPNRYLHRPEAQRHYASANYRYLIYELGAPGEQVLHEMGHRSPEAVRIGDEKQFAHSMMINDTLSSIELGVRGDPSVGLISWQEIIERQTFPQATRSALHPHTLPVAISYRFLKSGETHQARFNYTADCYGAFGLAYAGDRPSYRFFSHESEHKNVLERGNLEQTSFLKKFLAIRHIQHHALYRAHWGLPNLYHLFVAPTRERIESMKALILRETGGAGDQHILFRDIPVLGDVHRRSRPMPELFNELWERAGFAPLRIDTAKS